MSSKKKIAIKNAKGEVTGINSASVLSNLDSMGFGIVTNDKMLKDIAIVKVDGNYIDQLNLECLKDVFFEMAENDEEKNAIIRTDLLSPKFVKYLNRVDVAIFKDPEDMCHIFFKNGVYKIRSNGECFMDELDNVDVGDSKIWKSNVIDRDLDLDFNEDWRKGEFARFCSNVVGEDGLPYLMRAMGYLIHSYKDPANPKAVILSEGNQDDHGSANGGTGKSLIATVAMDYFRNISTVDGKRFNQNNQFNFQGVEETSDIIAMEDVPYNFKYDKIYNYITGDAEIERKHSNVKKIPFDQSPKILITTNYGIPVDGESDKRRRVVIGLKNYYNSKFTPFNDFGHRLFDDWNGELEVEWQYFFRFAIECVKLYFKHGIDNFNHARIESTALRKFYGANLHDFCMLNYRNFIGEDNAMSHDKMYEEVPRDISSGFKSKDEMIRRFTRVMASLGIKKIQHKHVRGSNKLGQSIRYRTYYFIVEDDDLLHRNLRDFEVSDEEDIVIDKSNDKIIENEELPF